MNCPKCKSEHSYQDGTLLADGDTVTVIKDLYVKGARTALKSGTKIMDLKSEFVRIWFFELRKHWETESLRAHWSNRRNTSKFLSRFEFINKE